MDFIRNPEFHLKKTSKKYNTNRFIDKLIKYTEDFHDYQYNYYKEIDLIYNVNHERLYSYDMKKRFEITMKKLVNIDFRKCIDEDFYKGFYDA